MLQHKDYAIIERDLTSSEHDVFYWAGVAGEPFLDSGVLSYFDGTSVYLPTYPFGDQSQADSAVTDFTKTVDAWSHRGEVEFINVFGPFASCLSLPAGFDVAFAGEPEDWNVDLLVDLRDVEVLLARPNMKHRMRRAEKAGVCAVLNSDACLSANHIALVRTLCARDDWGVSDVAGLLGALALIRSPQTTMFDARRGDELVGFAISHAFFATRPFWIAAAFKPGVAGAADAVMGAMIPHYASRGAVTLGLGFTAGPGHKYFKECWGGKARWPAPSQRIWKRCSSSARFDCSLDWGWRLLHGTWLSEAVMP